MPSTEAPPVSALSNLIRAIPHQSSHPTHLHALAVQIQHNLQHQHDWTSLHIHMSSPLTHLPLPRPLISGLPPHRIYVHPDDQVDELKKGVKSGDNKVEREWILPTHLKEKWTLRRFAELFDAIEEQPPIGKEAENILATDGDENIEKQAGNGKRRGGKRLLLATVGDDSTVVYYIVHDGIVKPRQN